MPAERHRKAAVAAVNGSTVVPEPPSDLEEAGREVWDAAHALPRVKEADAGLVAQLGRLRDEEARLRKAIAADGEIQRRPIQNAKGEMIGTDAHLHPGLAMLRRIGKEAVEAADALGLSPQGRHRLGLDVEPEVREPDWLDALQAEVRERKVRHMNGGDS